MLRAARRERVLKKMEAALRRQIAAGVSDARISAAAERVRASQLSLFKGQRDIARYVFSLTQSELAFLQNLEVKESQWKERTVDEIVEMYELK